MASGVGRRGRVARGLGVLALLGALTVVDVNPVGAAFPGRNGKIYCNSSGEIFAYDPALVDPPRQLTMNAVNDLEPTVSPDGTKIAFTRVTDGDQEIWIMNADGSGAKRLTFSPGEDRPGTFSPDGTKLAFQSARFPAPPGFGHSSLEIFTMNIDGTDVRRMTNNQFQDSFAHWSPQGDRIAFTTNRDSVDPVANFEIYTLVPVDANADGNADVQTRVTNSPGEDAHAHWSPDGTQLVFHSRRDFQPSPTAVQVEIYRANSTNGSNAVRLTGPDDIFDVFPSWSPDGQRITWSHDFPSDVFTMNASDGSNKVNITNTPDIDDSRCDWARLLPCTITGAGTITGTGGDDVICGSAGADQISALGGNDVIYAGGGDDRISAGAGNDKVFAGFGADKIYGEEGDDIIFGDQGNDQILAAGGADIASGSEDTDAVIGGDGVDDCFGEQLLQCP